MIPSHASQCSKSCQLGVLGLLPMNQCAAHQGPTLRSKFIWTSTQTRDGDQPYEKWSQRRRPPFYGPFLRKRWAIPASTQVLQTNRVVYGMLSNSFSEIICVWWWSGLLQCDALWLCSSAVRPRAPWGHDSSMDYQAESEDE